MDEVYKKLKNSQLPSDQQSVECLTQNLELMTLGAIGPDLFYYLNFEKKFLKSIAVVYQDLNKIPDFLTEASKLASKAGMDNFASSVEQLTETAKITFGIFEGTLTKSLLELQNLISGHSAFPISELQKERPEIEWNWGDILHDRRSGIFARQISEYSRQINSKSFMAYSIGYKSHLMTDFVGHPYVNQVVGGPARGWNMRHTLAEKFMDAKAFFHRGHDINNSKIDKKMQPLSDRTLDELVKMLETQLKELVSSSSTMPYNLPNPPNAEAIKDAVNNMITLFGYVTNDLYVAPPTRPKMVIPPLPGQYRSITMAIGSLRPPSGGHLSLADILKALLYTLLLLPSVLTDISRAATDIIEKIIIYPMEALLYLMESFLYKLYRSIRWYLVVGGIAFPCQDELNSELGKQFTTCPHPEDLYPRRPEIISKHEERITAFGRTLTFQATNELFLNYPLNQPSELPTTTSSIYPGGIDPEYFINHLKIDQTFLEKWKAIDKPSDLKRIIEWPERFPNPPASTAGFGNAVDLTLLYNNDEALFDNINLDSDRGYGYNQWTCDGGIIKGNIIKERFL